MVVRPGGRTGETARQTKQCRWGLGGRVIFDLHAQGRILGIEILDTRASLRDQPLAAAQVEPPVEQTLPNAA